MILTSQIERAAARSVILNNNSATTKSLSPITSKQKATTASSFSPPQPWASYASRNDLVPVMLCSIAVTTLLPASVSFSTDAEQTSFNKTLFDPFLNLFSSEKMGSNSIGAPSIQNGSSTILVGATRRANYDRIYSDTANFDFLEMIVPRGALVIPIGIVWVSVTDEFREDVLGRK